MKSSLLPVILVVVVAACRDAPQAPNTPIPSAPGPFEVVHVDFVPFFSDCCTLIAQPQLFIEPDGSLHLLYGATNVNAVRYAGCAAYCNSERYWRVGVVDSNANGDGGQVAAGLAPVGLHVLYQSAAPMYIPSYLSYLNYGWCPGACNLKPSWRTMVLDTTMASIDARLGGASAAVDASGGVRALYIGFGLIVRYAECSADCTTRTNWRFATLDSAAYDVATALSVGPDGRAHALYFGRAGLRYATCAALCSDSSHWQRATIVTTPAGCCFVSAAVGPDGRVNALYWASPTLPYHWIPLVYTTCAATCTAPAAWQSVQLDSNSWAPGLALGPDGSIHVAYSGGTTHTYEWYAHCDSGCATRSAWSRVVADSDGARAGFSSAIRLTPLGRPVIAYVTGFDVYVAMLR